MPTIQTITQLTESTAAQITHSKQDWTGFLTTAARLYKYPYPEQLMIYAQRPNATACASYDLWNKRMGRFVHRHSQGIALIDATGDTPKIKYVFDISDTGGREQSRRPLLWEMKPDHEDAVMSALEREYGVSGRDGLADQIRTIAAQLADLHWQVNRRDILYNIDGSFAAEYDEFNQEAAFVQATAISITYAALSRCGLDPDEYIDNVEYLNVFDFNTPSAVNALGTAVSSGTEQLLRQIERTVKQYEQEKTQEAERSAEHGTDQLQAERGLSDSRPGDGAAHGGDRQIREDAEAVSDGTSPNVLQFPAAIGEAVSAPAGDRADGQRAVGADDAPAYGIGGRDRSLESVRSDEVGGSYEYPQSPSGGNDFGGADLQLKPPQQLSLFPSEAEQIAAISQAESQTPSAFSISQAQLDMVLQSGSNNDDSRLRIAAKFIEGKPIAQIADFLRKEYRGGKGFKTAPHDISVWFSDEGIRAYSFDTVRYVEAAQLIPWEDAAQRIGELLEQGQYLTNVELAEVDGYERSELAQRILYVYHDFDEQAKEQGYLPSLADIRGGGYPEETAALAEKLAEPEFLATFTAEYGQFLAAYQQDRSLIRFHYHHTGELFNGLNDLALPRREYATDMTALPDVQQFITEDEINAALAGDSAYEDTKLSVFTYFVGNHTAKEKADFLKDEYGWSGRSHAISGASRSWLGHSGNGMELKKGDCPPVELSWSKVANRINELIRKRRYLTSEEKTRLDEIEQQYSDRGEELPTPVARFGFPNPDIAAHEPVADISKPEQPSEQVPLPDAITPSEPRPLTQADIDAALQEWNGDTESKLRVQEYMQEHARDKEAAAFLRTEYGDDLPAFPITGNGASTDIPWTRVQRHLAKLISEDRFFTEAEQAEAVTQNEVSPLLEQAKALIDDFCESEYDSSGDYSDLEKIGVAYTTVTDDEIPIQVNVNLVDFRLERYLDDVLIDVRQYASLQEFIDNELNSLDFSDLTSVTDEEIAMTKHPTPQFSFSVGDTVYLEDGKPYIVESITDMHIQLRDPSLYYSILRAESRASFSRLMERYPQPKRPLPESKEKPEITAEVEAVYPAEQNHLPYDIVIERLHIDEPGQEQPELPPAENFRITDDALGVGGAKTKYRNNVEAIRTLQRIEADGRMATPGEQEALSRYTGWGGVPQAFDKANADWNKEYAELKGLLSDTEYESARASTLNAHYTAPVVIRSMYSALERMGFRCGSILEPACGVGNFFGLLPESMAQSRLFGVELDSISGRIAQKLYPNADIKVTGFEKTDVRDFYDLVIGNVPFGSYKVADRSYDKLNFYIHDYFLAKSIDQARPGGIVAVITSKGTMDKQSPEVRRYLAQRAELLGAVRLPNNAFKANAGTEVTSDILFFRKRERPMEVEPDWVHLGVYRAPTKLQDFVGRGGTTEQADSVRLRAEEQSEVRDDEDGIPINSYFADHPEMVLGKMAWNDSMYGSRKETACLPIDGAALADQLAEAMLHIKGEYAEAELPDLGDNQPVDDSIPADPNVKNYAYTVVNGEVYYRENSRMVRPTLNATAKERIRGMVELRDCVYRLIDQQLDGFTDDAAIRSTQAELNRLYDTFVRSYGHITNRGNHTAFSQDSAYYLLSSLEVLDDDGAFARKADMFRKRTVRQQNIVTSVDTASAALALSISEKARVDLPYMAGLSGKTEEQLAKELSGVIFRDFGNLDPPNMAWAFFDPARYPFVTADEFLSGNVRAKYKQVQGIYDMLHGHTNNTELLANIQTHIAALERVQPKDLEASEIAVKLIDPEYIKDFMDELLDPPRYVRDSIKVHFSPITAEWSIEGKKLCGYSNVAAYVTYGTGRANAYYILEDSLNQRDVRIYDTVEEDGKKKRVLNSKETTLAAQRQQAMRDAFRDWIWRDPDRRHDLVTKYNALFNSIRPREYDGSHITFSGINPEIELREHQKSAIAHILYGGNTLLAHEVGAGKTFEMVAAAMESKRLGLCSKSLIAVPNHLTEQWAAEFLRLYPSANLLVTTKKDFEKNNRKRFCSRITTGDYDAIIMGHSQFERIPISMERQEALLREQIWEIADGIEEVENSGGERFTVKQLERTKRALEARLDKLLDGSRKDDVVTFEQLGVDKLFVDESHNYKNLFLYTKMQNVAGLSTSDAQKSSDMFAKCRYMDERTGGKGVVFATGTPVSNSMTEIYTMQRYLQYATLERMNMVHFDCWASNFGETTTAIELAPEGTGYRARTRFARFHNLPELMNLFKESADIKTADQLDLPVPAAAYETVVAKPSDFQKEYVQSLSERATAIHAGIDPRIDNMLKVTSDGRKLGLDQRIINPLLPDDPNSKVNLCVQNILRIWREGQEERLTQLVFSDISTPKNDGSFTVYNDIRAKLVASGVPAVEVAFIHEANTETQKKELFGKVRSGQVRVLIGSTAKMGAGTNVQDRLIAMHDLDCPWRPGDLAQRAGRIVRQGNRNPEVHIYRYVTDGTFDSYLWVRHEVA